MDTDLTRRLQTVRLTLGEIYALTRELPPPGPELDQLTESLINTANETGLTALMFAIIASGRSIDTSLLPKVLPLMHNLESVTVVALHSHGDAVAALLKSVESGMMGWEREATLLLIAGWLCMKREPKEPLPPNLIPKARLLAREVMDNREALLPLLALAHVTQNAALQTVLAESALPPEPGLIDTALKGLIERPAEDPLGCLPQQMDRVISTGETMRRAVEKVGRNEPCPCGSGKKYKKCCFEKDQTRLQHSSDIAGVTTDELEALPEPFLTREKLHNMRGPKLARLRIEMLPPNLQRVLLERLSTFHLTEPMLAAWDKVGWREDLDPAWELCIFGAIDAGQRDVVARLAALRGVPQDDQAIPFNARLMLQQDNPEKFLRLIEDAAVCSLNDPNETTYIDLAHTLLDGNLPGLGTLVARGAAVTARPPDAEMLFEAICKTRDRLDLSPDDPGEWILDRIFEMPEDLAESDRETLANAQRQIDVASAEAKRLRAQLAETRAQLERQERLARNKSAPGTPVPVAAPDASTPALRARIDELKSALKERHEERNALRRELNDVLEETAELREAKAATETLVMPPAEPEREDLVLLAEERTMLQPLRVPEFPRHFFQTLEAFPQHIARSTIKLIGELAAGEPAAFAGMRRLRVRHDICRVRVAANYRLLFKAHSNRLEVLDLINRKDFERWLKTLP